MRDSSRPFKSAAFLVIALFTLSACRSTLEKSGLVTPDPVTSEMFVTKHGGFTLRKLDAHNAEVRYNLTLEPRRPITQPLKLEITFENPEDKRKPLTLTQDVAVAATSIDIESTPLAGLKPAEAYEIVIRTYDANGTLLGTHRQLVHSIIAMKGSQVRIYK